jgi:hypothetical protein
MGETQRETDREGNRGIDIRTERGGVDNCKRYRKEGGRERERDSDYPVPTFMPLQSCAGNPGYSFLAVLS